MNLFILDTDPKVAATYHCDRHVVKMILETSQMLSTAHHVLDGDVPGIYKPAYQNHPCTVWVRETSANYSWALQLLYGLHNEYTKRYGKIHRSVYVLEKLTQFPKNIKMASLTPFAQAMPKQYQQPNAVKAYRNYYNYEKRHLFQWTNALVPGWVSKGAPSCDFRTRLYYLTKYSNFQGGQVNE